MIWKDENDVMFINRILRIALYYIFYNVIRRKKGKLALLTCIKGRHVVISAATDRDNEVSEAFPVAGCLRVTVEVTQLSVFLTITIRRRQVGLLKHRKYLLWAAK